MQTIESGVQIGFIVSKRMSYSQTSYLADDMGTTRTNDSGKAFVWGNVSDAQWAAVTQNSTQWEVVAVYQEW